MCLYPKIIENRKYRSNKKNAGIIPALPKFRIGEEEIDDERVKWVPVGCGKCMECKKKKAREWQVRLQEDIKENKNAVFVTLTFNDKSIKELSTRIPQLEGYDRDNEIATIGTRLFLERWRKKYKKSVRHWLVTELGHNGTENIHLHGLIWTDEPKSVIEEKWEYGYVWVGDEKQGGWVNEQTVNYIVKYINKQDKTHQEYNPKILTSAGIGKGYFQRQDHQKNKYNEKGTTNEAYRTRQGHKIAIPIYYRNHTYTDEEKEKLWIKKLDENIRYVDGKKIDVSKGDEQYYEALAEARAKNKQLGFGDDTINWDRKRYERDRRNMNHKIRIKEENNEPSATEAKQNFVRVNPKQNDAFKSKAKRMTYTLTKEEEEELIRKLGDGKNIFGD